jgi:NAD(P)-dependent dehydrogenase (short-subunit alcohol dehydrogenase family)
MGEGRGTALVAGGAGGIGSAISRRLKADGFDVVIADLNEERVAHVSDEIGATRRVVADLTSEAAVIEAVDVARDGGRLSAVICTQGISPKKDGRKPAIEDISADEWDAVLAVNLKIPFLLSKVAHQHLDSGAGGIVMISSVQAKLGSSGPKEEHGFPPWSPAGSHYSASKAAVSSLVVSLAREFAPDGIRVNGIAPGYIAVGGVGGMGGSSPPDLDRVMKSQVPLGRAGTPDEVAGVASFLVSEAAAYMTGEVVTIGGGWAAG